MSGWTKFVEKLQRDSGVRFNLHDLRRTMRTGMSRLGVDADTAELALGHAREELEAVNNRDDAVDRLRDAFATWADHMQKIVSDLVEARQRYLRITADTPFTSETRGVYSHLKLVHGPPAQRAGT